MHEFLDRKVGKTVDVRRISTPGNPQGHPITRMET